ncbi:MAG: argininosuccinate synthase, partial [Clostridia bacterium]|nr:argininosuccinate synthase [Clostridia bacterium]
RIVEIAKAEGADAICHGCTGKGNDQVRFELTIKAFAPDMPIIAPWREWDIKSREQEIDYAEAHNVPLKISRETNYSKDKNIWHLSHEGLDLEDPANEPQYNKEGCDAICHGCTGKGNDQVRFELTIKAFAPDMPIIAPWREWDIKSREEEIDYAEAHNVPLKINRETNYSKDKNLWHLSHEGLDLEDTGNEPQYEKPGFLEMGVSPIMAPDKPTYIELDFVQGAPVALNGEKMSAKDIILALNKIGGENGIGLLDIVENRLVGMKCRGVYETPGGAILYKAHSVLESICLDKYTLHEKQKLAVTFGELVYNGQWFTPLREALSAFVDKTQETVTGKVRLKLYKGNMINAGVWSDYSLYSEEIATFGESDYDQSQAAGFINLFGLPITVKAMVDKKNSK